MVKLNTDPGVTLIERLRFCPELIRLDGFDGFAIDRADLARLLSSRTDAANELERLAGGDVGPKL